MTSVPDAEEISFDGFREWLPVPTAEVDPAIYTAELLDVFTDDPVGRETIESMVHGFIDLGTKIASMSDDEFALLGAWALLAPGGKNLDPRALATFGAQRVRAGATAGEVVDQMLSEVDLYQPPLVETLDTASGPATLTRIRRHTGEQPDVQISEMVVVVWLSEELDIAYVLSSLPMDDLLVAADYADAVKPLAASVQGLV